MFRFTAPSSPFRHREALSIFHSTNVSDPAVARIPDASLGAHLFDVIARFLDLLGVPRGLKVIGYSKNDIPGIAEGAVPQRRMMDLAPGIEARGEERQCLEGILEAALAY